MTSATPNTPSPLEHIGAAWHLEAPDRVYVPEHVFSNTTDGGAPVMLLFPADPEGFEYDVLTLPWRRIARAPVHRVGMDEETVARERMHVVTLTRADTVLRTTRARLPWTRLDSVASLGPAMLSMDDMRTMLAQSIQATAELRVLSLTSLPANAPRDRQFLTQYATERAQVCDAFFAMFIMPRTRDALAPTGAITLNAAAPTQRIHTDDGVFAWKDAAKAPSIREWLRAADTLALLYARLLPMTRLTGIIDALDAHKAYFGGRLPATALAWIDRIVQNRNTPLNPYTHDGAVIATAFYHVRADVARWCVSHAPRPTTDEMSSAYHQLLNVVDPLVASWDKTLEVAANLFTDSVVGAATAVDAWGALALAMAQHSGLSVLTWPEIIHGRRILAEEKEASAKQQARYRALGYWQRPDAKVNPLDRMQRLAAVNANSLLRLKELLVSDQPHESIPPCIRRALQRGRELHHLNNSDRFMLAPWLVALQPATIPPTHQAVVFMAHFALGADVDTPPHPDYEETLAHFTDDLVRSVVRRRKHPHNTGKMCAGVIAVTLEGSDKERTACVCPHAHLRTASAARKDGIDNYACTRECARATEATTTSGARIPVTYHPMDRVLWAKEASKTVYSW